jgi:hypothetical protein
MEDTCASGLVCASFVWCLNPPSCWWRSCHKWLVVGKICTLTPLLTHLMVSSTLPATSKLKWIKSSLMTLCCHPPGIYPVFLTRLTTSLWLTTDRPSPLLRWLNLFLQYSLTEECTLFLNYYEVSFHFIIFLCRIKIHFNMKYWHRRLFSSFM